VVERDVRDRIRELRRVKASELVSNPKNWRRHPKEQSAAMRGLLNEIGYAGALLARELPDGKLQLIDGHLRLETTPKATVPVLVLDVKEAEADKILLTFDPTSAMAQADNLVAESTVSRRLGLDLDGSMRATKSDLEKPRLTGGAIWLAPIAAVVGPSYDGDRYSERDQAALPLAVAAASLVPSSAFTGVVMICEASPGDKPAGTTMNSDSTPMVLELQIGQMGLV